MCIRDRFNAVHQELFPGSVIDFEKRRLDLFPTGKLLFWLAARGIDHHILDSRAQVVEKLMFVRGMEPPVSILPKFLLKGGGGYVAFEVLTPVTDDEVDWKLGDAFLAVV